MTYVAKKRNKLTSLVFVMDNNQPLEVPSPSLVFQLRQPSVSGLCNPQSIPSTLLSNLYYQVISFVVQNKIQISPQESN